MTAKPKETPEIQGPPEQALLPEPELAETSSYLQASESSKKIREREEMAERVARERTSPAPEKSQGPVKLFRIGEGVKPESAPTVDDIKALAATAYVPKKERPKRTLWKSHKGFPKKYPELFWMKGSWKVFDDVWRHSKKTGKGSLRFEGYKRQVSDRTGVPYITVKRIWKFFEAKGLFLKVLVGRKNLGNLGQKGKRVYLPTIEMLPWSPAHYAKLIRERSKKSRS